MPPKASVAWASIVVRCRRMSRYTGRIREIHVRWLSQIVGISASDPMSSRQSTTARMISVPVSWITARHGL